MASKMKGNELKALEVVQRKRKKHSRTMASILKMTSKGVETG